MKKLNKLFLALAGISAVSAGFAVGFMGTAEKATEPTKAVTEQTTRRIWAVDATDTYWFVGTSMYLHLNTAGTDILMTRVLEDFQGGLFYADIDSTETGILFRNNNTSWTNNYDQTVDVTIKDTGSYYHTDTVFYINQNSNSGKCPVSHGTASLSQAQLQETMRYYSSCDTSYAYGYNSYPFVKNAFYNSAFDAATITGGATGNYKEANNTTVGDKMAVMRRMYNADHGTALTASTISASTSDSSSSLVLGGIAAAAVLAAGGYFFVRKKKVD